MAESESTLSIKTEEENNGSEKGIFYKMLAWNPPPFLEKVVVGIVTPILLWMVTFLLVGDEGLPGGQIFALLVIIFAGIAAGYAVELIRFPPLLGMLAIGMIIRNVPGIRFGNDLQREISSPLRQIALVVILIRAGLGLDPSALKKLSTVVIRLAFSPCLVEATVIAITSYFILDFPWAWGFLLGFVLAAVSPAVTVPCLLSLRDRGYGVAKGIPTMIIAAASVDDILAISAFSVALGFAISQEGKTSMAMNILQGPIEIVLGILFGVLWGAGLGLFITNSDKESTIWRVALTFFGGCLSVFGFEYVSFSGSGALGCLTAAFVAAIIWRSKGVLEDNDDLNWAFQKLWFIFQPLLFGLIGTEIDFYSLDTNAVIRGLMCLCIALAFRILTSFYIVMGAGLTTKERAFVALAWLPKATVQAAIGSVAYDIARKMGSGDEAEKRGLEVLTIAVLAILLTAPIGAIAIMLSGPKLLTQDSLEEDGKTLTSVDKIDNGVDELTHDRNKTSFVQEHNNMRQGEPILPETKENGPVTPLEQQDIRIQMVSITSSPKPSG